MSEKQIYLVKSPLRRNRQQYAIGASIALLLEDAAPLVEAGAIALASEEAELERLKATDPSSLKIAELQETVRELIDELAHTQANLQTVTGERDAFNTSIEKLKGTLSRLESDLKVAIDERDAARAERDELAAAARKGPASSTATGDATKPDPSKSDKKK